MNVRREKCMCDITANILQHGINLVHGVEEVNGHKSDPRVNPCVGKGPSGGHNNLAPGEIQSIKRDIRGNCAAVTHHSSFGWRTRCSIMLNPLMPFAPVTKATFRLQGATISAVWNGSVQNERESGSFMCLRCSTIVTLCADFLIDLG